jgi:hypothetical protein
VPTVRRRASATRVRDDDAAGAPLDLPLEILAPHALEAVPFMEPARPGADHFTEGLKKPPLHLLAEQPSAISPLAVAVSGEDNARCDPFEGKRLT